MLIAIALFKLPVPTFITITMEGEKDFCHLASLSLCLTRLYTVEDQDNHPISEYYFSLPTQNLENLFGNIICITIFIV